MARFRKSSHSNHEFFDGKHRYEHWYRDRTVYFITARCRDKYPSFRSEEAKAIFWDRFLHYTPLFGFVPFVTTLLDNHYHTVGFLSIGANLGPMMQRLHGSVAKLVNDLLPERRVPFFRERGNKKDFDGCLRFELQVRRSYRYTLLQALRAGIVTDYHDYPHTIVNVELERALTRCQELNVYLPAVPYARYQRRGRFSDHGNE